jgi:hypothetical protein
MFCWIWSSHSGNCEERYLRGCEVVYFGGSSLLLAGCILGLLCDPEEGSSMFLRSIGEIIPDYTTSHSRRQYSSICLGCWLIPLYVSTQYKGHHQAVRHGVLCAHFSTSWRILQKGFTVNGQVLLLIECTGKTAWRKTIIYLNRMKCKTSLKDRQILPNSVNC